LAWLANYDLFVLKIEVTRLDDGSCRRFTFQNSVRDDLQFGQFQTFVDYLIGSGLTAERVTSRTAFGPPISAVGADRANPAEIIEAYSTVSTAGLDIRQEGSGPTARLRLPQRGRLGVSRHPFGARISQQDGKDAARVG